MDENLKVLKGYINDSASAAHDVLLTTTDPDVGNAANNMLINSIRVGAVLEDISLKSEKIKSDKDVADAKQKLDNDRFEFEKKKVEFEKDIQEKRLKLDNEKLEFEKDIQEKRLKLDNEKLAYEKEEGERKAEEAKQQRKSDVKKVVIGGLIGVASVAVPVIIKAIVDAKAEDSKMAKTKAIFSAIYEAETEGVMPFSGEGGGLLRDICKEVITK